MNTLILEQTEFGEVAVDVFQKLVQSRTLFLTSEINDDSASDIVATLLYLDSENSDEKITLFINSNGGDIRAALMIYDTLKMIKSPVSTICIGSATDEAALLHAAGEKGMRFATKNAVIAISHIVHNSFGFGNLGDANSFYKLSEEDNKRMLQIIADASGKKLARVTKDFERRVFMTASEAKAYGIIDRVRGES